MCEIEVPVGTFEDRAWGFCELGVTEGLWYRGTLTVGYVCRVWRLCAAGSVYVWDAMCGCAGLFLWLGLVR